MLTAAPRSFRVRSSNENQRLERNKEKLAFAEEWGRALS